MLAIFKHSLNKSWGAIFGWGLTLALLGIIAPPFYESMAQNSASLSELLEAYPPEFLDFFGGASMNTPEGYLSLQFFSSLPLFMGIYAVLAGSGMLRADEQRGVLDLVAAHPVGRSALYWGRVAGMVLGMALVVALGYLSLLAATSYYNMGLDAGELLVPFFSLLVQLSFFAGFSLFLSMLLPSRQAAAMIAGALLVISFFLGGLANIDEGLQSVNKLLPLAYYQGTDWVDGLKLNWALGVIAVDSLFTLAAWQLFLRRDIRLGGEDNWQLPGLGKLLRRKGA